MSNAKWIWYDNDFEIYHNEQLHLRRFDMGCDYPCMWHLPRPEVSCVFYAKMDAKTDTTVHVYTHGQGMIYFGWSKYPVNKDIPVKAGSYEIRVYIQDHNAFPSIFIDNEYLKTDESFTAEILDKKKLPVGATPEFTSCDDNPAVFPFEYEKISPVSEKSVNGGILLDYGKEYFGIVKLKADCKADNVTVCFGESEKEALDVDNAIVCRHVDMTTQNIEANGCISLPGAAFRYLWIYSENGEIPQISALYEYLPIKDKASFCCNDENISKIWDMCAYTFHLNSREFYLDGIKRDRWVWSGDAYQSYMVNRYLYFDNAITRRTITALLGKPPYIQHINTINDYSAFLIIGLYEYYFATGDSKYVNSVWHNIKALYEFITSRLDDNGYVVDRDGDWIFIDWANIDKSGATCAEQILLWQVYNAMAKLSELCGEKSAEYVSNADVLQKQIMRDFWCEEKSAFIDSFSSNNNHISRHPNIFAILYDFVDAAMAERIAENVLYTDKTEQITTPYFKLYELMAICKLGNVKYAQDYIDSYWGGMLALGATTVWEQFDPTQSGDEHLEMYGAKFGKSLCHAWGSGPIYLLGRYCAGVYPTSVGYESFDVCPKFGKYTDFSAVVPVANGSVTVKYDGKNVTAVADVDGGTLKFGGISVKMSKNVAAVIEVEDNK